MKFNVAIQSTVNSEIFVSVLLRSFVKIKFSRNAEITQSFTDLAKSCPSRELVTSQISVLTLFAKIKFLLKFPDLQYCDDEPFKFMKLKLFQSENANTKGNGSSAASTMGEDLN